MSGTTVHPQTLGEDCKHVYPGRQSCEFSQVDWQPTPGSQ